MAARRRPILALALALCPAVAAAGCGAASGGGVPSVSAVPLTGGAHVVAHVRSCDHGAHAYCAVQLVVADPGSGSSQDLMTDERALLRRRGWTDTQGDTPAERSADSPGHRLRVSYATAADDLLSWDQGTLMRRRAIARALAKTMFDRAAALSVMVQTGSS